MEEQSHSKGDLVDIHNFMLTCLNLQKSITCKTIQDIKAYNIVGEPEIQKLEKKWPESSRILDYILS